MGFYAVLDRMRDLLFFPPFPHLTFPLALKSHKTSHPHLRPLVPPLHNIRSHRVLTGPSVLSQTRRCTQHAHLGATVHATTLRMHRQYYYNRRTSLLWAGHARYRCQPACGQAVLGRPANQGRVCIGIVGVMPALFLRVMVRKEWSVHHRKVKD
jgi:hypothetical protein